MEELLHKDRFVFNPEECGGTQLSIEIKYFDNGDAAHGLPNGIFDNQILTLESYSNSASFNLTNGFTPDSLRELANIIERGHNIALSRVKKVI